MARVTIRERLFALHQPADVERLLARFRWSAVFKAGTSDKTFEAWEVTERALEPRADVAVGIVRLPEDRAASDFISTISGIVHRSPQLVLFDGATPRFHLDELAITPDRLAPLVAEYLPQEIGSAVRNEAVVTVEPFRALLRAFVAGDLPQERFEWAYLDRLEKEAAWRDDAAFAALNSLFENPWDRDLRAARLVAMEFQARLAGTREPLKARAEHLLARLAMMEP